MKVITLKFNEATDWYFLLELMKRLNFHVEWSEQNLTHAKKEQADLVDKLFGSFSSHKSSDELVNRIYEARVNQRREINL